ncbi:AcrB/AcrD/AcrF family protein [Sphingomonas sp. HF-S4]|uniref:AcrB/AcrD/AcrF family protein n=1 Tax=Sphingomonas agrestis TaxID=3080540 RepID=A0ABU3YBI8_9SPHN|nr:AcrB/AcrD/AcrF family protein [Sphingomonas sp. HF-S4]MDV3458750.1 AcrB/AcrD/AcrF family protein [Sphingomonas sp. HF-S4]
MLVFWLGVVAWYVWQRQGNIYWLTLGDTDDNLRLAQVRALLAGQGWYDLRQYRLDPALGGLDIHWSRIVDLPIAGLILLLKPLLGTALAEKWACGLAPLLPLGLTMTGLCLTVRRLVAPQAWLLALVILMGCTSTMLMYAPLRIDHHGWQLACLALTVAGLADRARARGGVTVGLSSALSLSIGLELLPYCAMAGAIIALRWVWDAGDARRMQVYGLSLAGGTALGFALFASNANQALRCDALTPVWLSVMVAAGTLLFALSLLRLENRWVRLALAAVAGGAIVAGFVLLFPQCLGRPEQVSDELARTWLSRVREAKPIYEHSFKTGFPIAVLPIIGVLGALLATWRARRSEAAVAWAAIALFTAFAGAMLLWQIRAGPAAQLLGVPGATVLAWLVVPWFLARSSMLVRVFGSVLAFLLVTGLFAGLVLPFLPSDKAKGKPGPDRVGQANAACARMTSLRPLDAIPKAVMFTHVDMGPRLIVVTHHDAIAGPYHRNGQAILDVHHAFTGPASGFRAIAARHKAQYLLVCPNLSETTVYRARNPNGFYGQLHRGQVPSWLEPVALPAKSPFRLWRIRYDLPDVPVSAPKAPPRR